MPHPPRAALLWGIRRGFRDYVAALPDALVELDGVVALDDGYRFPAGPEPRRFGGRLHITAHAGALDVVLDRPAVDVADGGVVLTADLGAGRRAVARLLDVANVEQFTARGGSADDVALTVDGSAWLGGVYGPWARMDPVRILVPEL